MDILWAPWRMAYITENGEEQTLAKKVPVGADADPDCFLCQAVFDLSSDPARFVLRRTKLTLSILNRFPYNNGHLLVAPRSHRGKLWELTKEEKSELMDEIDRWTIILQERMNPDGFNIGLNMGHSAGAGLPGHLHWHIVPRWDGDTNFTTTIGSTKVMPQSLEALWKLLVGDN
jgi:ATP adenylyltransferase